MMILLLSGALAAGKTSLATELKTNFGFERIRTGAFLEARAAASGMGVSRTALQELGDGLDLSSDYRWVIDEVTAPQISDKPDVARWLIDSVRKHRQVYWFRGRFGQNIFHAHLTAGEIVLQTRYESRLNAGGEYSGNTPYEVAVNHENEIEARSLISIADIIVDTSLLDGRGMAASILKEAGARGLV